MTDKPDDGSGAEPGDVIYLGSNMYGIIGPPDPCGGGGPIAYTYTMSAPGGAGGGGGSTSPPAQPGSALVWSEQLKTWVPGDELPSQGSRLVPAVRFEIDGWEYSFPSKEVARKVQDKLNGMILEGEL
jgi:hypothetical protein